MRSLHVIALVLLALGVTGCGSRARAIRRVAAMDLSCAEKYVDVDLLSRSGEQYLAKACGRRAVYTWSKQTGAMRISAIEGAELGTPPPPPPPPPAR
jgi:hypothetical protein